MFTSRHTNKNTISRPDIRGKLLSAAYILTAIFFGTLCGCSPGPHKERLDALYAEIDDNPAETLDSLQTLDVSELNEDERCFRDFMVLKAKDKSYVRHTSDSVIKRLTEYYGHRTDDPLYPEILYYGGRVYSDLGDYPTAMKHFRKALDAIADNENGKRLRSKILSQSARLLNRMRLHNEALENLTEAAEINGTLRDTVNLAYNTQLRGCIELQTEKYADAENDLNQALILARRINPADTARIKMYLAATRLKRGDSRHALALIRDVTQSADSVFRSTALAYAAGIYAEAGIADTALVYARELAGCVNQPNRKEGYRLLVSESLASLQPADSLRKDVLAYAELLEDYYRQNEAESLIQQEAVYNYSHHEQERIKAELSRGRAMMWIAIAAGLLAISLCVIMFMIHREHRIRLKLFQAIDTARMLKETAMENTIPYAGEVTAEETAGEGEHTAQDEKMPEGTTSAEEIAIERLPDEKTPDEKTQDEKVSYEKITRQAPGKQELKQRLIKQLKELKESGKKEKGDEIIRRSRIYGKFKELIKDKKPLEPSSELWETLRKTVTRSSGRIIENITEMAGGRLNDRELHVVLLTRCGFSTADIAIIENKRNTTVWQCRNRLFKKVMGYNETPDFTFSDLISSL